MQIKSPLSDYKIYEINVIACPGSQILEVRLSAPHIFLESFMYMLLRW